MCADAEEVNVCRCQFRGLLHEAERGAEATTLVCTYIFTMFTNCKKTFLVF